MDGAVRLRDVVVAACWRAFSSSPFIAYELTATIGIDLRLGSV
jgi:hypothetical protein